MIPGQYCIEAGEIELNAGRRTHRLSVSNRGDRPIQVGSHYHFFETNDALMFEHFGNSIGVANVRRFEPALSHLPRYVTPSERGAGFAEAAAAVLRAR